MRIRRHLPVEAVESNRFTTDRDPYYCEQGFEIYRIKYSYTVKIICRRTLSVKRVKYFKFSTETERAVYAEALIWGRVNK